MRLKIFTFCLLILTGHWQCQSPSFQYINPAGSVTSFSKYAPVSTGNAVDVSKELYKVRGSENKDCTVQLQALINKYKKVVLPNRLMLINDSGILIPSGAEIYFQPNSKIKMLPSAKTHFDILKLYDCTNVKIYNAVIEGERKQHRGTGGEWAAGIGIRNADNVIIQNVKITDTWGDGIFIGSESGGVSKNIFITNADIDYARRNGLSVTSGQNVHLKNFLISNTFGTAPMCGVDIEPSLPQEFLTGIVLENFITFNNENSGMNVNTSVLEDTTPRKVDITISNHRDVRSSIAFSYSINAVNKGSDKITGRVQYRNAVWDSPRRMEYWKTPNKKKVKVVLQNVTIQSKGGQKKFSDENF